MRGQPSRLQLWAAIGMCAFGHSGTHAQSAALSIAPLEQEAAALQGTRFPASPTLDAGQGKARLAEAERLIARADYAPAYVMLSGLVAADPERRAYPDAPFLWAEAAFGAGDWLGARDAYRGVVQQAVLPAQQPQSLRALARLIEIALRTRDFDGIDDAFARMAQLPAAQLGDALHYLRGKYVYAQVSGEGGDLRPRAAPDDARWLQARAEFSAVDPKGRYGSPAGYFIGVVELSRGATASALEVFAKVAKNEASDAQQAQVVQLARLALGRLYYDNDLPALALRAYQAVPLTAAGSFEDALFEMAWVHIRDGDSVRAQWALELLDVAAPHSLHLPEAKLLRANLLLRDGRFLDASRAFGDAAAQFGPVRDDLDRVLTEHDDQVAYFRQLVRANLDVFDATSFLPSSARSWVARGEGLQAPLQTLSELTSTRQLVQQSEAIAARLSAALAVRNVVAIFADLRGVAQRAEALRNAVAQLRAPLLARELQAGAHYRNPELDALRARRAIVEHELQRIPTTLEAFSARTQRELKRYDAVAQALSQLTVELAGLQARVSATERFVAERSRRPAPAAMTQLNAELAAQRLTIAQYRSRTEQLARALEVGRLRSGAGDLNSSVDRSLRDGHSDLVQRERGALAALGAQLPPVASAELARLDAVEAQLDGFEQRLKVHVAQRVQVMRGVLAEENAKLGQYRQQLAELELRSQDVVGGLAQRDYKAVRLRFYDLLLRADAGIVDVGWAVRENYRLRGEMLSRDRVRELKALDDEYHEIAEPKGGEP